MSQILAQTGRLISVYIWILRDTSMGWSVYGSRDRARGTLLRLSLSFIYAMLSFFALDLRDHIYLENKHRLSATHPNYISNLDLHTALVSIEHAKGN